MSSSFLAASAQRASDALLRTEGGSSESGDDEGDPPPPLLLSDVGSAPWLLPSKLELNPTSDASLSGSLSRDGILVAPALLSRELAFGVRNEILAMLPGDTTASRQTIPLQLSPQVAKVLQAIAESMLAFAVATQLGEDAALYELYCTTTQPGAAPRPPCFATPALAESARSDSHRQLAQEGRGLFSVTVALGMVDETHGPTLVWPRTHTEAFHTSIGKEGAAALRRQQGIHLDLRPGDAAIVDSRLYRCEGPNAAHHNFPWDPSLRQLVCLVATFAPAEAVVSRRLEASRRLLPHLRARLSLLNLETAAGKSATPETDSKDEEASEEDEDTDLGSRWGAAHLKAMLSPPTQQRCIGVQHEQTQRFAAVLSAAEAGDASVVLKWLDSGGEVDARAGPGPTSLLMAASASGQLLLVDHLIRRRASVNWQTEGSPTALHLAARAGDPAVVHRLLAAGGNVDLRDAQDATSAHWAALCGHTPVVDLLRGQWFEPVVLRQLCSEEEVEVLLAQWAMPGPRFDDGAGHSTIYLHAGQADGTGLMHSSSDCAKLIARIIETLRQADPRKRFQDYASLASGLSVRCCELHRYVHGGGLMQCDHRDSDSSLTLSVTLADRCAYGGGHFLTWPGAPKDGWTEEDEPRAHNLGRGDGILFRSEDLHNVAPVTHGERYSLVIELWAGPPNNVHRYA